MRVLRRIRQCKLTGCYLASIPSCQQQGVRTVIDVVRGPLILAVVLPSWFAQAAACRAQDYHPWALFEVGCWRQTRVVTETLDAAGTVESVRMADTKATLTAVDENSYSLRVDETVELAGRRFQAEPKVVKQGFLGETVGQLPEVKVLGPGEVSICGRRIATEIQEIVTNGSDGPRTSILHVADGVPPFVLKRETRIGGETAERAMVESQVDVLAIDMPYRVLAEVRPTAFVKTVQLQRGAVVKVIIEVQCMDVPGAVVAHSCLELDGNGRIVRRSTLELVNYHVVQPAQVPGAQNAEPKRRLFRHFRTRRSTAVRSTQTANCDP